MSTRFDCVSLTSEKHLSNNVNVIAVGFTLYRDPYIDGVTYQLSTVESHAIWDGLVDSHTHFKFKGF